MYAIACQGRKGYVSRFVVEPDFGPDGGICETLGFDTVDFLTFESLESAVYYVEFFQYNYLDDDFFYVCL